MITRRQKTQKIGIRLHDSAFSRMLRDIRRDLKKKIV